MTPQELKDRTKAFAVRCVAVAEALPKSRAGDVFGKQLLRSSTSVGAYYRSACRAKSKADFVSKIGTAIEEADETIYWLEMVSAVGLMPERKLTKLHQEANELVAILTASSKTVQRAIRAAKNG
mgnify:CR=1 FL=1